MYYLALRFNKELEMNLVKITEKSLVGPSDKPYLSVGIPRVFVSDNNLKNKDEVEVFRGNIDGKDALVIIPKKVHPEKISA